MKRKEIYTAALVLVDGCSPSFTSSPEWKMITELIDTYIAGDLMRVTPEERQVVETVRGGAATGYPLHSIEIEDVSKFYYWPWGSQPYGDELHEITARSPRKAAKKFLKLYFENDLHATNCMYITPKRRDGVVKL